MSRLEYTPLPPPAEVGELPRYIQTELVRISQFLGELSEFAVEPSSSLSGKPREGQLVTADGTNLDLGSGAGLYQYRSGVWVFLG